LPQFIVVTLNKELPEAQTVYAKAAPGKALARETDRLDSAARRKNVPQITSLLSENQETLAAQMREEGFDPSKMRLPPERWFPASDGLKTARALTDFVTANMNDFKQPNPIQRDLKAVEALLVAAEAANIQFHFSKVIT
jgi:hypothetical protein